MKIALWICTLATLLLTMPLAWLGIQWIEVGRGLHPMVSGFGVAFCLVLTGLGAWLIDRYEPD